MIKYKFYKQTGDGELIKCFGYKDTVFVDRELGINKYADFENSFVVYYDKCGRYWVATDESTGRMVTFNKNFSELKQVVYKMRESIFKTILSRQNTYRADLLERFRKCTVK